MFEYVASLPWQAQVLFWGFAGSILVYCVETFAKWRPITVVNTEVLSTAAEDKKGGK